MARIRVTYSLFPVSADNQGQHDALNVLNYKVTGPGVVMVKLVQAVSGDLASFELLLDKQLTVGAWKLTVSNVQTVFNETLTVSEIPFPVIGIAIPPVIDGAKDSTAEDVLHKNFNPALVGKAWDALIAALATSDTKNWANAQLAFDQMFISSAASKYLDRKTGDVGIGRPMGVGMSDELFRKLAIIVSSNKLTQETLLEVLEIFYGSDAVRGSVLTDLVGPFSLTDGDDLQILLDEVLSVNAVFNTVDFTSIGIASATEVTAVLNRTFERNSTKAFAIVWIDNLLNEHIKIYSGSLGLASSVRVAGGRSQNIFQFPHRIPAYNPMNGALPTWNITILPAQGRLRFTTTGVNGLDLSILREGDYVNIYGTEFQAVNRGTYTVVRVYVAYPAGLLTQYFEIVNINGAAQAGLVQIADSDLYYFRPVKAIISKYNGVSVLQGGGIVDIDLPATTQAVNRGYLTAAYANAHSAMTASNLIRSKGGLVQVTVPSHGLAVGQQIEILNAIGTTTQPITTSGGAGNTDSSLGSIWSPLTTSATQRRNHTATTLKDGRVLTSGGYSDGAGTDLATCELFTITSTTFVSGGKRFSYTETTAGVLPAAVSRHTALLMVHPIVDGQVLLVGGINGATQQTASYLYTPATGGAGSWAATGSLTTGRFYHQMAVLADGQVMVTGGNGGAGSITSVEVFSPLTALWTTVNPMATARSRHAMVLLQNGSILVCGGLSSTGAMTGKAEVWDPLSGIWSATGAMSWTRAGHQAVVLSDGRVLVVGGTGFLPRDGSGSSQSIRDCEIYDPRSGIWSPAGRLDYARDIPSIGVIDNDLIVAGGGSIYTELLDLTTMKWSRSRASMPDLRDVAPAAVTNGAIYASCGTKANVSQAASTIFIPASERIYAGGLNGIFTISGVPDGNTIQFNTVDRPDLTTVSGFTFYPVAAAALSTLGPHTYDPVAGLGVTAKESTTSQSFTKGLHYQYVDVADATQFPDSDGWLCFGFGTSQQVAPVRYFGRLSNTRLKLDFKFVFPKDVKSGVKIVLLINKGAWVPQEVPPTGAFYVTGSNAGVAAASKLVDDVLAGGIPIKKIIVYPGDRGLGGEGLPVGGTKEPDKVLVWGPDDLVFTHAT